MLLDTTTKILGYYAIDPLIFTFGLFDKADPDPNERGPPKGSSHTLRMNHYLKPSYRHVGLLPQYGCYGWFGGNTYTCKYASDLRVCNRYTPHWWASHTVQLFQAWLCSPYLGFLSLASVPNAEAPGFTISDYVLLLTCGRNMSDFDTLRDERSFTPFVFNTTISAEFLTGETIDLEADGGNYDTTTSRATRTAEAVAFEHYGVPAEMAAYYTDFTSVVGTSTTFSCDKEGPKRCVVEYERPFISRPLS